MFYSQVIWQNEETRKILQAWVGSEPLTKKSTTKYATWFSYVVSQLLSYNKTNLLLFTTHKKFYYLSYFGGVTVKTLSLTGSNISAVGVDPDEPSPPNPLSSVREASTSVSQHHTSKAAQ